DREMEGTVTSFPRGDPILGGASEAKPRIESPEEGYVGPPASRPRSKEKNTMNRKMMVLVPAAVLLAAVSLAQAQYGGGGGGGAHPTPPRVLKFTTMVGVGGFLLSPNDVRGVVGDDLPWQAKSIKGELLGNGQLTIKVRGLVFPNSPSVPEALRGINDEPQFFAVL